MHSVHQSVALRECGGATRSCTRVCQNCGSSRRGKFSKGRTINFRNCRGVFHFHNVRRRKAYRHASGCVAVPGERHAERRRGWIPENCKNGNWDPAGRTARDTCRHCRGKPKTMHCYSEFIPTIPPPHQGLCCDCGRAGHPMVEAQHRVVVHPLAGGCGQMRRFGSQTFQFLHDRIKRWIGTPKVGKIANNFFYVALFHLQKIYNPNF